MNHKKEPVIILDEDNMLLDDKMIYTPQPKTYPFAVVLRLRVLQVPSIPTHGYLKMNTVKLQCNYDCQSLIIRRKHIKFCFLIVKREKQNNITNPNFRRLFFYSFTDFTVKGSFN